MKTKKCLGVALAALLTAMVLAACNDDDKASDPQLVENASLAEGGQTLSPGDTVHLTGNGYLAGDDVMLNFYWETGEAAMPEGYIKGYYADILERASDGIAIRLPYRKPEARVEVVLVREGTMMLIGEIRVSSGATPKEARLYGINNNLSNKGFSTDLTRITRCASGEDGGYGTAQWELGGHPDFHSVVACWESYGLCGLSKENGISYPFFFDFCTAEWKQIDNRPTIALCGSPYGVEALQQTDGDNYALNVISGGLDKSDYVTAATKTSPVVPQMAFPLPEGLEAELFGEYPGTYTGMSTMLFSANKGNGKWTPVLFDINDGFRVLDDIEADGLIPFSFPDKDKKWRFGYIVAREHAVNGTELYISGDTSDTLFDKPYAVFPNRAVSVSANYDNPGILTVHFLARSAGNVTENFSYDTKEWKTVDAAFGYSFDEVIWTN